jgi:perosamine synthetase
VEKKRSVPVAAPALVGREREYVLDCLDSSWISSTGRYIDRFERGFAAYCGVGFGVGCCNGTAALHVALRALGVGPGDEVIVPTLTFVATANAVAYCGAEPVFVDSEPTTWNMDPAAVAARIGPRTKGVLVVHLYGHPVDMDPILEVARRQGLFVVEDAAQAHGAEYKGRRVGSLADAACFSFYGSKLITTGEGGMVVTDRADLAERARVLRGQGQDPTRRYWFPVLGHNYRMTNIAAAIGLAQLERIDWHLGRHRENAAWYRDELRGIAALQLSPEAEWARSSFWMSSLVLAAGCTAKRDDVLTALADRGIETRPFFPPMHTLPIYAERCRNESFPVAERLAARGFNLPSAAGLSRDDVAFVASALRELIS